MSVLNIDKLTAQSAALDALTATYRLAARDEHGRPEPLDPESAAILGDQARRVVDAAKRLVP